MEFTADYQILKDRRPHWTLDERFNDFDNSLRNEYFTFKEVCDLCQFETLVQQEITIEDLEQEWSSLVRKWQRDRNMLPKNYKKKPVSALGFVGICFYYTLLHRVFDVIGKSKVQELFTLHEINVINLLYYYQYRSANSLLSSCGASEIAVMLPLHPLAWIQFLDEQYDKCTWYVCYMTFEKMLGLRHVLQNPEPTGSAHGKNICY